MVSPASAATGDDPSTVIRIGMSWWLIALAARRGRSLIATGRLDVKWFETRAGLRPERVCDQNASRRAARKKEGRREGALEDKPLRASPLPVGAARAQPAQINRDTQPRRGS
jgi:hypothetical protein